MNDLAQERDAQILDQFTRQAVPFAMAPSHSTEESLRILMESVAVAPDDDVLDVACGPGIVTCALARVARWVTGVDFVPAMLDEARKRQREMGAENVEWRVGDANYLPYPDDSFSLVATRYSFHHLLDPAAALRERKRVCRPGGRIAVADVTPEEDKGNNYDELETARDPSHTHALPLEQLRALGKAEGLQWMKTASYRLDNAVETLLAASFPLPGKADQFRKMVREDIGVNRFSIDAYIKDGEVRFSFPVSIVVWTKPAAAA